MKEMPEEMMELVVTLESGVKCKEQDALKGEV